MINNKAKHILSEVLTALRISKRKGSADRNSINIRKASNILKRSLLLIVVSFLFVIASFFIFRNTLLHWVLDQKIKSFNEKYGAVLVVKNAHFHGISNVSVDSISLNAIGKPSLLQARSCDVSFNLFSAIFSKLKINNLELDSPNLTIVSDSLSNNYDFLLKRSKKDTIDKEKNYAKRAERILNQLFDRLPQKFNIANLRADFKLLNFDLVITTPRFFKQNDLFFSQMNVDENGIVKQIELSGNYDKSDMTGNMILRSTNGGLFELPFLKYKWGLIAAFNKVAMTFAADEKQSDNIHIKGNITAVDLLCNHWRVSPNDVKFSTLSLNFDTRIFKNEIVVDSTSSVDFNKMHVNFFCRYNDEKEKQIQLKVPVIKFQADDFFSSLPEGLFGNLKGIKTQGALSYAFNLELDMAHIDSLKLESELKPFNFKVLSFGKTDFRYVNDTFTYAAYDKGVLVRKIQVGPSNANFRILDEIPNYLKNAVLNSEDGAFFYHRGFLPDAIRESLIADIKQRRFVRGGSTISMQLIRNVYLNRDKNISRKVEEMLITWLVETNRWVSKERMYEIYLNVIEWGPNVYGANEGARFYFNKDASKLTLAEAIFMASIVPHPKTFMYNFDKEGNFKDYIQNYYTRMADKMLKKEYITSEDYEKLKPEVELVGPAKALLKKPLTINDSLLIEE